MTVRRQLDDSRDIIDIKEMSICKISGKIYSHVMKNDVLFYLYIIKSYINAHIVNGYLFAIDIIKTLTPTPLIKMGWYRLKNVRVMTCNRKAQRNKVYYR
jgi:hypothetical protein